MTSGKKGFSAIRYGEGETAAGQLVRFQVDADDENAVSKARAAIGDMHHVDTLSTLPTRTVEHGSYETYTRFDIDKIEYRASRTSYHEILRINDAPDDRHSIVSHLYSSDAESYFAEWETVEDASNHTKTRGTRLQDFDLDDETDLIEGLKRVVKLGMMKPWFYAVGEAKLMGDYAFPEEIAGHPVYGVGRSRESRRFRRRFNGETAR